MVNYISFIVAAILVILVAKFVLHVGVKTIVGLVLNAVFGFIVLYVINLTGLIAIPLNIVTSLVVGILGVPGVIILIILTVMGIL